MKKILLLFSTVAITGIGFSQYVPNNIATALPLSKTGYDKRYWRGSGYAYSNRNILENSTVYNTAPNSGSTYTIDYTSFSLETGENNPDYQPLSPIILPKSGWYQFTTAPAYNFRYRIYDISNKNLTNTRCIISLYKANPAPQAIGPENSLYWNSITPKYQRLCSSMDGDMIAYTASTNTTAPVTGLNFVPAPLTYLRNTPSAYFALYNSTALANLDPIAGSGISIAQSKGQEYMELYDLQPNTTYYIQVLVPEGDCPFQSSNPKVSLTIIADILKNDGTKNIATPEVSFCLDNASIPPYKYVGVETEVHRTIDENGNVVDPTPSSSDHGYSYESNYGTSIDVVGPTGYQHLGSANYNNPNSPFGNNNTTTTGNWYFPASGMNARHHCFIGTGVTYVQNVCAQYDFGSSGYYYSFASSVSAPPTVAALEANGNICQPQHSTRKTGSVSGIETTILNGKINVFPNPTQSKLSVTLSDMKTTNDLQFFVYDANGKVVAGDKLNIDQHAFDVNTQSLAKGVYVLKVVSDGKESQTANFVKE